MRLDYLTEIQRDNFWRHVTKTDSCWIWNGAQDRKGYGHLRIPGLKNKWTGAHRYAYALIHGEVPDDLVLDHVKELCEAHELCVNPAHLEAVTQGENLARSGKTLSGKLLNRTHFNCGHEITEQNTLNEKKKNGAVSRRCKLCRTEYSKAYLAKYQPEYRLRRLQLKK